MNARVRPRAGLVGATFRLVATPAAAFLFLFPTIGYYTVAAYMNVLLPEGNTGGIATRIASLSVLIFTFFKTVKKKGRHFNRFLLPATIFFIFYCYRLLENMFFLELEIRPGNTFVLLSLFFSSIIPAYMLASMARVIRDEDMIPLLSIFAVLFLVGMALNRDMLIATASEQRAALEKINPISLAYVVSSLLLFYMLTFARSKATMIEALMIVPVLLLIVSMARSRGMIISTCITLIVYVLALRGTRKIWTLIGLGGAAAAIGFYADPEHVASVIEALDQVGQDRSSAERAVTFEGAWNQFLEDPVFGRYAIEFQLNFYPHNIYLESLMSVGVVGTAPFIVHLGMALRAAIGLIREKDASFTHVFVALLFIRDGIGAAASGAIWGASGFWIASFIVIAMWYGRRGEERPRYSQWSRPKIAGSVENHVQT
jgi:hypothetical protein